MSSHVERDNHPIDINTRHLISNRYKRITKAVNIEFWNSTSETTHSRYVGSYGRGTAIFTSDLDVLIELPETTFQRFSDRTGNGQSQLLQTVKSAIESTYATTNISGDGQVVVANFTDGIKFEILPAFQNRNWIGEWNGTYKYPNTHMGGNWMTTNPYAEQAAMDEKDDSNHSNGLLKDTCKHIRFVKAECFPHFHLSGILIDTFVYNAIMDWHWLRPDEQKRNRAPISYEQQLLNYYNSFAYNNYCKPILYAPGSNAEVSVGSEWNILGKVLNEMV